MEKAKVRKIEQEIVFERNLIKERKKEDHLFGDKEKFVTKAYKQKLAEQAKWLEEEKKLAAVEAANDVLLYLLGFELEKQIKLLILSCPHDTGDKTRRPE